MPQNRFRKAGLYFMKHDISENENIKRGRWLNIKKYIDDILLLIGAAIICYGVFLIYIPAGFITTGLSIIGIAYLVARNGPEGR